MRNEPIRWTTWASGLLAALSGALLAISQGVDPLAAAAAALGQIAVIVGGGEIARSQAWGPRTVGQLHTLHRAGSRPPSPPPDPSRATAYAQPSPPGAR